MQYLSCMSDMNANSSLVISVIKHIWATLLLSVVLYILRV